MKVFLKSLVAAFAIVVVVQTCTVGLIAPKMSRSVAAHPAAEGSPQIVRQAPGTRLVLENEDGAIRVYTHEEDAISAEVTYRVYTMDPDLDGEARLYANELVRLTVEDDTTRIVTEPEQRPEGLQVFADYVLYVPIGMDVKIRNSNGNVIVADAGCHALDIQGRNMDVNVVGASGPVYARSTNGRVRVRAAAAGANIETVNGNIYAHVSGGELRAETTNGQIVARLIKPEVSKCALTTRNGGITVVMSEDSSAQVEARTARGAVTADVDVDASDGIERRRHLRGVIGKGQTALTMDSLNGNIWILRRAS